MFHGLIKRAVCQRQLGTASQKDRAYPLEPYSVGRLRIGPDCLVYIGTDGKGCQESLLELRSCQLILQNLFCWQRQRRKQ